MYIFKKNEKISYLFGVILLLLAALFILTGCSSDSGGDGGTQLETIEITVSNYEDFVTALEDNQHTMIVLANDIEGKNESLKISALNQTIIDFGSNNFKGDFNLQQPENDTSWDLTFDNGSITGDLTIDDPKLSLTLNDNFSVEGETNIENAAANTFLNKGEINNLFITDNDGVRIVNEGTINGDIEIDSIEPSNPVILSGNMENNNLKVKGENSRVRIDINTSINTITVDTKSSETEIMSNQVGEIAFTENSTSGKISIAGDFDESKIKNKPEGISISSLLSGEITSLSGFKAGVKVILLAEDTFDGIDINDWENHISNKEISASYLDNNHYVFDDINKEKDYIILAHNAETGELGFYGGFPKKINYNSLNSYTDIDIKISDQVLVLEVASTDLIKETETALYNAEVDLYSSAQELITEAHSLFKDNDGYAVTLFTGLETGEYYLSAKYNDSKYSWGTLSPVFEIENYDFELDGYFYLDIFNDDNLDFIFGDVKENYSLALISFEGQNLAGKAIEISGISDGKIGYLADPSEESPSLLDFNQSEFNYTLEENIYVSGIKGDYAGEYKASLAEIGELDFRLEEKMLTFIDIYLD